MATGLRFHMDRLAVEALAYDDDVDDVLQEAGDQVAEAAQSLADRKSVV